MGYDGCSISLRKLSLPSNALAKRTSFNTDRLIVRRGVVSVIPEVGYTPILLDLTESDLDPRRRFLNDAHHYKSLDPARLGRPRQASKPGLLESWHLNSIDPRVGGWVD